MDYYAFSFTVDPDLSDALLGLLSTLPFESFEERETELLAYLPASVDPASLDAGLEEVRERIPFSLQVTHIPAQNWNEVWESNFSPIQVGHFCGIRAEFHPSFGDTVAHELLIHPRMAFGTGHHETTYMMIQLLEALPLAGKKVLDYGCGTGILAILAARLGAGPVDALEIDPIACENAEDNCRVNQTPQVTVLEGTLDRVANRTYDIVLANINRHVLLASFIPLYGMLPPGGLLLISGILGADREIVGAAFREAGFRQERELEKGQWIALELRRA